jgi:transmembrane sensor
MDANERRERASQEAAEWWQALEAGELSQADREQFTDWLRESAVHVAELMRIALVHNALAQFKRWANINTDGPVGELIEFPQDPERNSVVADRVSGAVVDRPRTARWMKLLTLAAALAGVALAAGWLWLAASGQVIETARGERREVALGDGSVLQIDPETRLTVRLDEERRQIFLERGRTLFRVARDAERPFIVRADGTIVRALGTAFGVEHRTQGIIVTVAEGKVAVLSSEGARSQLPSAEVEREATAKHESSEEGGVPTQGPPGTTTARTERLSTSGGIFLVANQQVTVPRAGSVETVRQVDSSKELAWAEGRLVFEDDTVAEVVREFNRYNLVQLHVTDDALAARTVSGVFDASDPGSFVAFMQTVADVTVVWRNGQDITITSQ